MNYFKLHIGDYATATAHLSFVEDGAYSRLIRRYYATEKALPREPATVARLVGARSKIEVEAVRAMLNEFFELREDGWHQLRCDREIESANGKAEHNREVGKRGGRPPKTETQMVPEPNGNHNPEETQVVSKPKPNGNPDGSKSKPNGNPDGSKSKPNGNPSHNSKTRNPDPDPISKTTHTPGSSSSFETRAREAKAAEKGSVCDVFKKVGAGTLKTDVGSILQPPADRQQGKTRAGE